MPAKQKHPLDVRTRGKETRPATIRKLAGDGTSWTPTEVRKRDKALKQFSARAKGFGVGLSEEFRHNYEEIDWTKGATIEELEAIMGGKKK